MLANRKTVISLIILAFTAVFSTASISTNYGVKAGKAAPVNFVGTYYTVIDGVTTGGVLTLHSDGTVSSLVADMFEFTEGRVGRRSTSSRGVWSKVGNNEVRVTTTFFFSGIPTEENPDGVYGEDGLVVKITFRAIFEANKNGVSPGYDSRDLVAEVFLPTQNPNTDTPVSIVELGDNGGGYRMVAK
jgi:hypothetical protein